jgi:4-aminobutyrate aminotransferase
MLGLEIVGPGKEPDPQAAVRFLEACRERGLLIGKGGIKANAIRISPPLIVTLEAAKEAADILEEALAWIETREKVG